jgi:hypothetical protein
MDWTAKTPSNYSKKKKASNHISHYDDYKVLARLTKPKSPITVLFCTHDLPDEWLIDMIEYRTKTGEVTFCPGILGKDLQHHIENYINDGYVKEA